MGWRGRRSLGFVDREEGAQAREGTEGGGEGGGQGREEGTVVVCMIFNVPQRKGRNQMREDQWTLFMLV